MKSGLSICLAAIIGIPGCTSTDATKNSEAEFSTPRLYCLEGKKHSWVIYSTDTTALASDPGSSYEVVSDHKPVKSIISRHDNFRLTKNADGTLDLSHHQKTSFLNSALLGMDGDGIWAHGRTTADAKIPGEYFIFKIKDRGIDSNFLCRHRNAKKTNDPDACKAIHIEFFADSDPWNKDDKPVLNVNVRPISAPQECLEGGAQTDEGDGDHGPD
ncbi:MAG: hypothetical protein KDI66_14965 [Xanthomonadales bacterium]|nr:hypothetical protein [Xanthomonadales bacterium]